MCLFVAFNPQICFLKTSNSNNLRFVAGEVVLMVWDQLDRFFFLRMVQFLCIMSKMNKNNYFLAKNR